MVLGLLEWTVRTAMLVLAGLVTLAILHAIHALSADAGRPAPAPAGRTAAVEQAAPQQQPAPQPVEEQKAPPAPQPEARGTAVQEGAVAAAAAAPAQDERLTRWVEAIAYALLALAGLVAIGLILLWQLIRQTRRLAEAAEARPRGG